MTPRDRPALAPPEEPAPRLATLIVRREVPSRRTTVGGGFVPPIYDEDGKLLAYGHTTE